MKREQLKKPHRIKYYFTSIFDDIGELKYVECICKDGKHNPKYCTKYYKVKVAKNDYKNWVGVVGE